MFRCFFLLKTILLMNQRAPAKINILPVVFFCYILLFCIRIHGLVLHILSKIASSNSAAQKKGLIVICARIDGRAIEVRFQTLFKICHFIFSVCLTEGFK